MIDYSLEYPQNRYYAYFSSDGSYGSAEDLVVIDTTELDGHFNDVLPFIREFQLPAFMRWYVDNSTHDQRTTTWSECLVCEMWEDGTEQDILATMREDN